MDTVQDPVCLNCCCWIILSLLFTRTLPAAPPSLQIPVCSGLLGYLIPGSGLYASLELQTHLACPLFQPVQVSKKALLMCPIYPHQQRWWGCKSTQASRSCMEMLSNVGHSINPQGLCLSQAASWSENHWWSLLSMTHEPVPYLFCIPPAWCVSPQFVQEQAVVNCPTLCWSPAKQHPLLSPYGQKMLPCRRWPNQSYVTCLGKSLQT